MTSSNDVLLSPVFADAFAVSVSGDPVMLRFMRNGENEITGFTLSTATVRRLRFSKL
jgi:hypothetical protein